MDDPSDLKMQILSSVLMYLLRLALFDAIVYSQIFIFIAAIYKPIQYMDLLFYKLKDTLIVLVMQLL